jgi:hypothetical protein
VWQGYRFFCFFLRASFFVVLGDSELVCGFLWGDGLEVVSSCFRQEHFKDQGVPMV